MQALNAIEFGYEPLTNLDRQKSIAHADDILANGWQRRNYPVIKLQEEIPWSFDSNELRSWNFYIHCLDMINPLLTAYDESGRQKYLDVALRIALDWVEKHPRGRENASPMAWYDMAVGLRAYRLAYLFQVAEVNGHLEDEKREMFWNSLEEHRIELANDDNIAFHNNHGYFQVAGQMALGRRFRTISQDMAELLSQGRNRLKRMIDQQFTEEGMHREHSPDYHRMVLDTLLGLVEAGLVDDDELEMRAESIENALTWLIFPSGKLVNFGDTDDRAMTSSISAADRKWRTQTMRFIATQGRAGGSRPSGLRAFPSSGYAVVRTPSKTHPTLPESDTYLAFAAAFHSRTHKHADDLSFVWYDHGEPILVDAGRYGYIGKTQKGSELWREGFWYSDPMRVYVESTRAHNTLEFDGLNFERRGVTPYGSGLVQALEHEGVFAIEGACRHFRTTRHERVLLLNPGRWLITFDWFKNFNGQKHSVRQWFHLGAEHRIRRLNSGYRIQLSKSERQLLVRPLLPGTRSSSIHFGDMGERPQGWWSPRERVAEPSPAFAFIRENDSSGAFATIFTFSEQCVPDLVRSRSNASGRKALLAWDDKDGHHEISFDRSEEATLGGS